MGQTRIPNYRALALLHNWLLDNIEFVDITPDRVMGIRHSDGLVYPVLPIRGMDLSTVTSASVFMWAALSDVPEFAVIESDYRTITGDNGKPVDIISAGIYTDRVFSLRFTDDEALWLDNISWHTICNSTEGLIARLRYLIENALDFPDVYQREKIYKGLSPLPYDASNNFPFDLTKKI